MEVKFQFIRKNLPGDADEEFSIHVILFLSAVQVRHLHPVPVFHRHLIHLGHLRDFFARDPK